MHSTTLLELLTQDVHRNTEINYIRKVTQT